MKDKIFVIKLKRKVKTEDIARFILEKYYGIDGNFKILRNKNSKPYIYAKDIYFSSADKNNYKVLVFSKNKVGIDLEIPDKKDHKKTVDKYFSKSEKNYIYEIDQKDIINRRFFEIWTKKEAVIKKDSLNLYHIGKIDSFEKKYRIYTFYLGELIISVSI